MLARLIGLTAKLSRDIDLEIGNTAEGEKDGIALFTLAWVCLWLGQTHRSLSQTYTHTHPRGEHWQPEVSGDGHTQTHTVGNIDFLFGIT